MKSSFTTRSPQLEIMDDLQYAGPMMDQTLRELEIINHWLGGNAVTVGAVGEMLSKRANGKIEIADLGCGRGDMLVRLLRWSKNRNIEVALTGVDANPYIIELARRHVGDLPIVFHALDVRSEAFERLNFDLVIGTLFYHHFSNDQLITFFAKLRQRCRIGFIINDIHRHPLAYHSIRLLTRLFSRSDMVRFDAPVSVLRAFSKKDLVQILNAAGCTTYKVRWRWAFRWQVLVETHQQQYKCTSQNYWCVY